MAITFWFAMLEEGQWYVSPKCFADIRISSHIRSSPKSLSKSKNAQWALEGLAGRFGWTKVSKIFYEESWADVRTHSSKLEHWTKPSTILRAPSSASITPTLKIARMNMRSQWPVWLIYPLLAWKQGIFCSLGGSNLQGKR